MTSWISKAVIAASMTSFLFLTGPAVVMAAGESGELVKITTYEETISNTLDEEIMERKLYERAGIFSEEIIEDGKKYTLDSITYTVDQIEETWKGEEHTITISDISEDALPAAGTEITEDGIDYIIKSVRVVARAPKAETEEVTEDVRYEAGVTVQPEITVTKETVDGSYDVRLTLTGTEAAGETPETREIPVVYHDYDAETYDFGGTTVEHNDDRPALDGLENQILASANLDPEEWTITDIRWIGSIYEASGELRRNAAATAEKRINAVIAHYTGTHTTERPDIVTAEADCESVISAESRLAGMGRIAKVYVTAQGIYKPVNNFVPKALLAGAGILAIAAALVIILTAMSKKEKRKEER